MAKPLDTDYVWRFSVAVPPREVFAVMEQLLGVPPYRFQPIDAESAEVIEVQRLGVAGNWTSRVRRPNWIRVTARGGAHGTVCEVSVSKKPLAVLRGKKVTGAQHRALQLVKLLTDGMHDPRSVYRERRIPAGPVTLVASWAGMTYGLFEQPAFDASRGASIRTATRLRATGAAQGPFIEVVIDDDVRGWVEGDQCVPSPAVSTREAQRRTAQATETF